MRFGWPAAATTTSPVGLGVAITDAMIDHGYLTGHDGSVDLDRAIKAWAGAS